MYLETVKAYRLRLGKKAPALSSCIASTDAQLNREKEIKWDMSVTMTFSAGCPDQNCPRAGKKGAAEVSGES